LGDALGKVLDVKEQGCSLAIISSSLGNTPKDEGQYAAQILRKRIPGIKIISYSTEKKTWGDINLVPPLLDELPRIIEELLEE